MVDYWWLIAEQLWTIHLAPVHLISSIVASATGAISCREADGLRRYTRDKRNPSWQHATQGPDSWPTNVHLQICCERQRPRHVPKWCWVSPCGTPLATQWPSSPGLGFFEFLASRPWYWPDAAATRGRRGSPKQPRALQEIDFISMISYKVLWFTRTIMMNLHEPCACPMIIANQPFTLTSNN